MVTIVNTFGYIYVKLQCNWPKSHPLGVPFDIIGFFSLLDYLLFIHSIIMARFLRRNNKSIRYLHGMLFSMTDVSSFFGVNKGKAFVLAVSVAVCMC